jgi:periplasmic divalent cation tolerance protein
MDIIFVHVTAPDRALAETLSLSLVRERLAACVNMIPGMKTIYRWQGTIEDDEEVLMIVKTTRDQFANLVAHVKQHHPYNTPCIVAMAAVDGEPNYMRWIEACCTPSKLA